MATYGAKEFVLLRCSDARLGGMKVFVSGKVGAERGVQHAMERLTALGHTVTFDWTTIPHLKPYEENRSASAEAARLEVDGVKAADVLVLLAHPEGLGMYVELGVALGMGTPVYVVSDGSSRTMFFHHPLVTLLRSVEELLELLRASDRNEA